MSARSVWAKIVLTAAVTAGVLGGRHGVQAGHVMHPPPPPRGPGDLVSQRGSKSGVGIRDHQMHHYLPG